MVVADIVGSVMRQSSLADGSGRENSAEDSWHFATFVLEYADLEVNASHAANLPLIDGIVEIDRRCATPC